MKAYEAVAALLGGKVFIKDNTTFIIGVTMSYKEVISTLKHNVWSAFTNLNPAHGGDRLKEFRPALVPHNSWLCGKPEFF